MRPWLAGFALLAGGGVYLLPSTPPWTTPSIRLSLEQPSPRFQRLLLTQRYFAVIGHPAGETLDPHPPYLVADPLARKWLRHRKAEFLPADDTRAILETVRRDEGALGFIPMDELGPEVRQLGEPIPIREWAAWEDAGAWEPFLFSLARRAVIEIPAASATLVAVGDIMLGRSLQRKMAASEDPLFPFSEVADPIQEAHVALGNLECAITVTGVPAKKPYVFRADPDAARRLAEAGFDAMILANNHGGDLGSEGIINTLIHLSEAGVGATGGGRSHDEAAEPWLTDLPDGTRLGLLAFSVVGSSLPARGRAPGIHIYEPSKFEEEMTEAQSRCDFLVVSFHWGEEYTASPTPSQRALGRKAVELGADLVLGHHPHWIQEIECYRDGVIAYSLGNFVFDQFFSEQTTEGLLLKVVLQGGRIRQVYPVPVVIDRGVPRFLEETPSPRRERISTTLFPGPPTTAGDLSRTFGGRGRAPSTPRGSEPNP